MKLAIFEPSASGHHMICTCAMWRAKHWPAAGKCAWSPRRKRCGTPPRGSCWTRAKAGCRPG